MRGPKANDRCPPSLVEPDMEISPIRLSPGTSLPQRIHNMTSPIWTRWVMTRSPFRARHPR